MKKTHIDGNRLVAFLGINGKVYSSDCDHQECLEKFYAEAGIRSEFDYTGKSGEEYEEVHSRAIKKTYALKNSHAAYGFDLFDTFDEGYVLLAHDKETYERNQSWMKQYQKENSEYSITLGYFLQGNDAILTEDLFFDTPKGMVLYLSEKGDLYCPSHDGGTYAFLYSDTGAVAVYRGISPDRAEELSQRTAETGESGWSSFLGPGGSIYDNAEDFCSDVYDKTWFRADAEKENYGYNKRTVQEKRNHGSRP